MHILGVPVMADKAFTVIGKVEEQPVGNVYVIVVLPETPGSPVTTALAEPMVASPVLLLVHAPPEGVAFNVVVRVPQIVFAPVIAEGCGLTVAVTVVMQPDEAVYVIVGFPADTPSKTPDVEPIVALAVLLLLHAPPV